MVVIGYAGTTGFVCFSCWFLALGCLGFVERVCVIWFYCGCMLRFSGAMLLFRGIPQEWCGCRGVFSVSVCGEVG